MKAVYFVFSATKMNPLKITSTTIAQMIVYEHLCLIQNTSLSSFNIAGLIGCDISDPAEQHSSVHGNSEEQVPWSGLEDWSVCSLLCSSGSVAFNSSPELKTSSNGSSGRGSNMKQACNEMNNVYNQS